MNRVIVGIDEILAVVDGIVYIDTAIYAIQVAVLRSPGIGYYPASRQNVGGYDSLQSSGGSVWDFH